MQHSSLERKTASARCNVIHRRVATSSLTLVGETAPISRSLGDPSLILSIWTTSAHAKPSTGLSDQTSKRCQCKPFEHRSPFAVKTVNLSKCHPTICRNPCFRGRSPGARFSLVFGTAALFRLYWSTTESKHVIYESRLGSAAYHKRLSTRVSSRPCTTLPDEGARRRQGPAAHPRTTY